MIYERKIKLQERYGGMGYDLYVYTHNPDGSTTLDKNGLQEKIPEGGAVSVPSFRFQRDDLQLLMEELARVNIKPKEASKTEGLYAAQSEHLKDLRKILKL